MTVAQLPAIRIDAVLVGKARPFGPAGRQSAIHKQAVSGSRLVSEDGVQGDEQADRYWHGGSEKAIHHYPYDHYTTWCGEHPEISQHFRSRGAFGENVSTLGLTETNVCIGDVFRLGSALVQVSQPRRPCWRLNHRFGQRHMARWVQNSGRIGWYYRVLQPGVVQAGDQMVLDHRPQPRWPLSRLNHVLYENMMTTLLLEEVAAMPELADLIREIARDRLEKREVEEWETRLSG